MSAEADSEMRGSSSGRDLADASGQDSRRQELASVANSRWKHRGQLSQFVVRYGISLVFVVLVASLTVLSPTFRRPENLWNILQQNSIIGVVSCGMLLMMIVGGFDLSVGSVGAASSIVAALLFVGGWISLGVVAALATGLVVEVVNAY